ncbi:MAG: O-antigen ligase family protein, partial [Ignavibacteriaceae bacterium]
GIFLKKIKLKHAFIIILLTAGISFISFINNQQEVTQRIEQPAGLSDRDIIYKAAGEILFEHPVFGFGPRSFQHIFDYRDLLADKNIGSWHNDILQMYFEGGITGLAAFLILIFVPLWKGFSSLKNKNISEDQRNILLGLLLSITALFLSSLTSGFINNPVMSIVFAFQLAVLSRILVAAETGLSAPAITS